MPPRASLAFLACACLLPAQAAVANAQDLVIDHKAVGCIVVGKFPKMNACFTPAPSLARGRVYFRPEGTPSWYYVEMKAEQPCYAGILPKPGKKLAVGDRIRFGAEGRVCLLGTLDATVEAKGEGGEITLAFDFHGVILDEAIAAVGDTPLPPYIASRRVTEAGRVEYQTTG